MRLYWVVRELRRIEIAGACLPKHDKVWLDAKSQAFQDLVQMDRIDEGFLRASQALLVPPNPDSQYDLLRGENRVVALEAAFASTRGGWDDDPARRAADWIEQPGNPVQVLDDLDSIPDGGAAFARVWEKFAWAHASVAGQGEEAEQRDLLAASVRVLSLLDKLPEATIRQAIHGLSHWLCRWAKQVVGVPKALHVWLKLWPIAVEVTNAEQSAEGESNLNIIVQSSDENEPRDLDTLNTPAGKMVGVFLDVCPNLRENAHPFDVNSTSGRMRDTVMTATGRSRLIALYRMIEELHYFLRADSEWTVQYLLPPLNADNAEAIVLWRAISRHTHFSEVLKIIGALIAERATDQRLNRGARRSFVFSLVIECLYALWEQRDPAVPYARIQQMIRSLDDEVRAYGAKAIQRFVHEVSGSHEEDQGRPSPAQLFRSAAAPFLQQVWPQERSLATPGVSRALANLPATAQAAFAEAVDAIERFLVPFECWSMNNYGLYGEEDSMPKLSRIDNYEKAEAFLRLLNLTIGTAEGSVIPSDLADALEQVRSVAPKLEEKRVFRRLATMARRG